MSEQSGCGSILLVEDESRLRQTLARSLMGRDFQVVRTEAVGPKIGEELKMQAVMAILYALVLILGDVARILWGTQQLTVPRPPALAGGFEILGIVVPHYNVFIILLGPAIAFVCWLLLNRTGTGRMIRAAAYDREMLAALGADVGKLYTMMFMAGSFLAGLGGALVTPVRSITPGMDVDIIVEAFIVVVIGGLGSFWGTFLGAVIFGQVLAFGILILPGFSIFAVFVLMAFVLIVRPTGLLGRPMKG